MYPTLLSSFTYAQTNYSKIILKKQSIIKTIRIKTRLFTHQNVFSTFITKNCIPSSLKIITTSLSNRDSNHSLRISLTFPIFKDAPNLIHGDLCLFLLGSELGIRLVEFNDQMAQWCLKSSRPALIPQHDGSSTKSSLNQMCHITVYTRYIKLRIKILRGHAKRDDARHYSRWCSA